MPMIGSIIAGVVGVGSAIASGVTAGMADRSRSKAMDEQAQLNLVEDQQKAVENKAQIMDLQQQEIQETNRYQAGHGGQIAMIGASGGQSSGFDAIVQKSKADFMSEISSFNTKKELLEQSTFLQQELANLSYRDQLSASQRASGNAALNGILSSVEGVAQIGLNYPWSRGAGGGINKPFEEELRKRSEVNIYGD